jgi:hypothetical protein
MEGAAAAIVLVAIVLGILVLVAFDLFCLIKVVADDRAAVLPKLAWAVFIVCVSPLGGVVYLLSRTRPRRAASGPAPVPR